MVKKIFFFIVIGILGVSGCKKQTPTEPEENSQPADTTSTQIPDIQGSWIGKWTNSFGSQSGIIHLSITQNYDTVSIIFRFDSMYLSDTAILRDSFRLTAVIENNSVSGEGISFVDPHNNCKLSFTVYEDTLKGKFNFPNYFNLNGNWWAIRGSHIVEPGWTYLTTVEGLPLDIFINQQFQVYLSTSSGLYFSSDTGMNFTYLIDTLTPSSICEVENTLFITYFGKIYKSTNNGASWQDITPPGYEGGGTGTILRFKDPDHGWVFTGDDLYFTADGGTSWEYHQDVLPGYAYDVEFRNDKIYIAGYSPSITPSGMLAVSSDGGATWVNINLPSEVDEVDDIYFDNDIMFIAGKKYSTSTAEKDLRYLFYSTDGGNSFTQIEFPGTPQHQEWIGKVSKITENTYIAVSVMYPSENNIVYLINSFNVSKVDTCKTHYGLYPRLVTQVKDKEVLIIGGGSSENTEVFYYLLE